MSRVQRLNEQFRREVSEILRTRVRDPRVVDVAVTGAEVGSDLYSAKIFVQLSRERAERDVQRAGLEAATSYIRGALGRSLTLRRVPEIRFVADDTLGSAQRIEELLRGVRPNDEPASQEEE